MPNLVLYATARGGVLLPSRGDQNPSGVVESACWDASHRAKLRTAKKLNSSRLLDIHWASREEAFLTLPRMHQGMLVWAKVPNNATLQPMMLTLPALLHTLPTIPLALPRQSKNSSWLCPQHSFYLSKHNQGALTLKLNPLDYRAMYTSLSTIYLHPHFHDKIAKSTAAENAVLTL